MNAPLLLFFCLAWSAVCYACPQGHGGPNCDPCPIGQYSRFDGDDRCTPCPRGTYSASLGTVVCADCPAGYLSTSTGSTRCPPCAKGTHRAHGEARCTACPRGSVSTSGSSQCLACPPLTIPSAERDACVFCDEGKFPAGDRSDCLPCGDAPVSPSYYSLPDPTLRVQFNEAAMYCSQELPAVVAFGSTNRTVVGQLCEAYGGIPDNDDSEGSNSGTDDDADSEQTSNNDGSSDGTSKQAVLFGTLSLAAAVVFLTAWMIKRKCAKPRRPRAEESQRMIQRARDGVVTQNEHDHAESSATEDSSSTNKRPTFTLDDELGGDEEDEEMGGDIEIQENGSTSKRVSRASVIGVGSDSDEEEVDLEP